MKPLQIPLLMLSAIILCVVVSGCGSSSGGGGATVDPSVWYADQDHDGFGNASVSRESEEQPDGYVDNAFDCDDTQAIVNPGQKEIVDYLDNDCDGQIDESQEAGIIPDTGQTTSFTNSFGEDSDYLIDPPSYTKLDETGLELSDDALSWAMVRDNVTGLIWEVKDESDGNQNSNNPHDFDNTYTFNQATGDFITRLNAENFGGFDDDESWRLPTIEELALISLSERQSPAINTDYFPNATFLPVWSSTADAQQSDQVWTMNFYFGSIVSQTADALVRVRAVRGPVSTPQLETFGSGIARDTVTGLMWVQDPATGEDDDGFTWEGAIAYCENLRYGGFTDWRLPTKNELVTLLRFDQRGVALDTEHLSDVADLMFWSSTSVKTSADVDYAWYSDFEEPSVFFMDKTELGWVRPVRGGNNTTTFTWYRDGDGDGYGDETVFIIESATVAQPEGYVGNNSDCNDYDTLISPVSEEIPNDGIDQDCTGLDTLTWYHDNDRDGYGNQDLYEHAEAQPDGYIRNPVDIENGDFDCDDENVSVNPAAEEITDDGRDNDCNGKQQVSWYADDDGDGYGQGARVSVGEDAPESGTFALNDLDCDDTDDSVHPGLTEILGDALDTNCNGDPDDETLMLIPDTGQGSSYSDTWGEDSDYLIHARSCSRWGADGQVTGDTSTPWFAVKDEISGLVWEVKTENNSGLSYTYQEALAYAANLTLCGYDDWRLPTLAELATLAHMDLDNPAIDTDYFPLTQVERYWTSSQDGDENQMLSVWFRNGGSSRQSTASTLKVRAVRGGRSLSLGLSMNGDRFIDNGDGTIFDRYTGLMWTKARGNDGAFITFEGALAGAESLEAGGYTDWRLPSRNELISLLDARMDERGNFDDVFTDPEGLYWSSTSSSALSGYAWKIRFTDESIDISLGLTTTENTFRAVRGGM